MAYLGKFTNFTDQHVFSTPTNTDKLVQCRSVHSVWAGRIGSIGPIHLDLIGQTTVFEDRDESTTFDGL